MKLKHKALTAAFLLAVIIFFQACKKFEFFSKETKTPEFTVAEAKEWYYGVFKKSKDYYFISTGVNKFGARNSDSHNDSALLNRFPIWSLGEYADKGTFEMVEFPYLANRIKVQIPVNDSINEIERKQIFHASLKKVVFVKNSSEQIIPRVVHIVPDYDYALKNNFDISHNNIKDLQDDFSGWIMSYEWNGKPKTKIQIRNGKTLHMYKVSTYVQKSKNRVGSDTSEITEGCSGSGSEEFWEPTGECDVEVTGDQPQHNNDAECETGDENTSTECLNENPPMDGSDDNTGGSGFPEDPDDYDPYDDCAAAGDPICICFAMGVCDDFPYPGDGNPPPPPLFVYNGYTFTAQDWNAINLVNSEIINSDMGYLNQNYCYGTNMLGNMSFPGTVEHWLIQYDYINRYQGGLREYSIPRSSLPENINRGYADIANIISKEIFEIKPDNFAGLFAGQIEALNYVTKANIECNNGIWRLGTNYT